ncbi:hypothetical protein KGF86_08505 [Ornithinibacillus massiliensis]|uniref:Uncharacterized protein n=1 Tax=Ornithinibacillus massiliensis TaxID=1944633 RepID=A0ABS5MDN0_9BACI|nr:hypothetical protein [Ornithinibacillus massiliensis]MBS3680255.1 hypothetical protein [Ornithinibacillus massiliensis]
MEKKSREKEVPARLKQVSREKGETSRDLEGKSRGNKKNSRDRHLFETSPQCPLSIWTV